MAGDNLVVSGIELDARETLREHRRLLGECEEIGERALKRIDQGEDPKAVALDAFMEMAPIYKNIPSADDVDEPGLN